MLIRLTGHFINNPSHIDKLICIKGLPEDWIFRESRFGGKELLPAWQPDIEANIPQHIRHLCEPTEITISFPPTEKGREPVVDKKTILGIKLDYMTERGRETWENITRYMDRVLPRDQRVPDPVLVAPNQKVPFETYMTRRNVRGSLELAPSEIPVVDLAPPAPVATVVVAPTNTSTSGAQPTVTVALPVQNLAADPQKKEPEKTGFACEVCSKLFVKKQAWRMHTMRAHKKQLASV